MTDIAVQDDTEHHRFRYREDDHDAQLVYRVQGDRLDLVHTEVPEELGGRGIAGQLVAAAVERSRRTGETLVPSCSYARRWLEEHPDATEGIAIDW